MSLINGILKLMLFALLILGLIIASPLLIIKFIIDSIKESRRRKNYPKFLNSIEGKKFLLHTNRQKTKEYIRFTLRPLLPQDIIVTTINDEVFYTNFDRWCFSHMIRSISPITYPVVIKVVNGNVFTLPINNEFYNTFHQNKSANQLIDKIKSF